MQSGGGVRGETEREVLQSETAANLVLKPSSPSLMARARSPRCMTDKQGMCKWQREKPGGNSDVSVHVLNMPHCSVTNQ